MQKSVFSGKRKTILSLLCSFCFILPSCRQDIDLASDEIYKIEKVTSIQTLFESIGRQPEIAENLVQAAENIAGYGDVSELTPIGESISKQFGYARGTCISACAEAIARQPESHVVLTETAVKFLGKYNNDTGITTQINEYSKIKALPGILKGISSEPEAFDSINEMSKILLGVDLVKK